MIFSISPSRWSRVCFLRMLSRGWMQMKYATHQNLSSRARAVTITYSISLFRNLATSRNGFYERLLSHLVIPRLHLLTLGRIRDKCVHQRRELSQFSMTLNNRSPEL